MGRLLYRDRELLLELQADVQAGRYPPAEAEGCDNDDGSDHAATERGEDPKSDIEHAKP